MSDRIKLSSEHKALLLEVVRKRDPSLLQLLHALGELPLSDEQREALSDILMNELGDNGIQPDKELNQRGVELCDLMTELGRIGMPEGGGALDELWRRIDLGVAEEQEKIEAAHLSGEAKDHSYVSRLLSLLDDQAGQVRYYALQSLVLGLQQTDEVEKRCWKLLREDPDEDVRQMAASCLGKINSGSRSSEQFSLLLTELKSFRQPSCAKAAIYGALFRVADRPPSEWPDLHGRRKVFEESDIDWGKIAWLEDQLAAPGESSLSA